VTRLPPATESVSEKLGNSLWVTCPNCHSSFPVSPELHTHPQVPMHCPTCHHEFHQQTQITG
jgi:NAD-dependent SIR2 family protein deacetylase